ncbi:hypothetical protein [uncultured Azohydromonas sp.]|uniref:hypothetical protein n=1 Tax=uncultured Azohydromonas sp. TaxID=487342 RepID=UPI00261C98FF|nr:hypothetical protein [uncultured Azohydromonas sp.]
MADIVGEGSRKTRDVWAGIDAHSKPDGRRRPATTRRKSVQSMDKRAWTAGFLAGGIFAEQCPYVQGSFEALDWYGGWIEGAANALDRPHYAQGSMETDAVPSRHGPSHHSIRH